MRRSPAGAGLRSSSTTASSRAATALARSPSSRARTRPSAFCNRVRPNGYPQNPNQPGVENRTLRSVKATGSYDAPYGIRLSPVLRHQSGANYARTLSITAPSGLIASGTAFAEPMNANREDNVWVFDVRAEKTVTLTDRMRARPRVGFRFLG